MATAQAVSELHFYVTGQLFVLSPKLLVSGVHLLSLNRYGTK